MSQVVQLLVERERERLAGDWPHILLLLISPVMAYGLVRHARHTRRGGGTRW